MIVTAALWAAGALLISGAIVWVGLRAVRTFGDYAARDSRVELLVLAIHESQQTLIGQNDKLLAALQRAKRNGKEEVA